MIDIKKTYSRCVREVRNAKSLPMLRVAYRYYELFRAHLKRNGVRGLDLLDKYIQDVYRITKKKYG